jgi:hypothetical protein
MKQLLFLLLFPCLALAQYSGNAGQKITLGEQTTADGLVYRGVANDTNVITPFSDTSAYIILDTVNNRFFHYKRNTNVWSVAGGSDTSLIAYVNTYGTQTVNGAKTFTSAVTATRFNPTASTVTGTGMYLPSSNALGFSTNDLQRMHITSSGNVGFGVIPSYTLHIEKSVTNNYISFFRNSNTTTGTSFGLFINAGTNNIDKAMQVNNAANTLELFRVFGNGNTDIFGTLGVIGAATLSTLAGSGSRTVLADANGVLSAPVSSINTKENVQSLNYGLNEILQINPVSFDYINKDKWGDERHLGFIVEDMFPVVPEVTGTMNNGDMYLDMTKLIPILTKAIQEQNVLIKALEQRILTLENK